MEPDPARQSLTSGEFARQTMLSPKALRIYDETGLLRPDDVDPYNGHRRYGPDQVQTGRLIRMLRGADMPLAEIGQLLADLDKDRERAITRLDEHLEALEARHTSRRFLIRHIHAILREEDQPMFPIQTRHVPAQRVMSIQRRLRAPETDGFVREAKAAFAAHLGGAQPTGPFTLIFHGIVDHESDGPLEAVLGCPDECRRDRPDRHPHRARPRRGLHDHHQGAVGLPGDPRGLRRGRALLRGPSPRRRAGCPAARSTSLSLTTSVTTTWSATSPSRSASSERLAVPGSGLRLHGDAELVALRVAHHDVVVVGIMMAPDDLRPEPGQPLDVTGLVGAVQVQMHLIPAADRGAR